MIGDNVAVDDYEDEDDSGTNSCFPLQFHVASVNGSVNLIIMLSCSLGCFVFVPKEVLHLSSWENKWQCNRSN